MDKCSVHDVNRVAEMIHSTGALLRFLPPYSPDLNPIESVFSKVKSFVKAIDLVFQFSPYTIVAMAAIQDDCIHCGYL